MGLATDIQVDTLKVSVPKYWRAQDEQASSIRNEGYKHLANEGLKLNSSQEQPSSQPL